MSNYTKSPITSFNLVGEATTSAYINKQEKGQTQKTPAPTPVVENAVRYDHN